jgi:hypothetical protein
MTPNNSPPPEGPPKGVLWILDPEHCDEYEFSQRLIDAQEKGKLYAPEEAKVH